MSSSTPYDPDEFDNNPFAQPAQSDTQPHPQQATPQQATHGEEQHEQQQSQPDEHPEVHTQGEGQQSSSSLPKETSLLPERRDTLHSYKLLIKVHGLERTGSLSNKKENPSIIFDLQTNLPHFRKKSYKSLKKSFVEFQHFFKFLNDSIPECFIPSLPLSSTNYGIGNEEDYRKTIKSFQTWFNKIGSNPIVIRNEEFPYFIDSDHGSYSPINKLSLPASGLKRKTLKQFQPPYDEVLELAEFRPLIKSIYQDSKSIVEKLEKLTKLRKTLGISENELGTRLSEFSELEGTHTGMSNMWKKIGKSITTLGDLDSIIGSLDLATFGDGLTTIANDGYVIKEALTNRHLLMRELITAQGNTKLKHENARKLRNKRDINPVKVDEAIRSLQEATETEEKLTIKIKRITEEMLIEKKIYLTELDSQIASIIKEFVLKKIELERRKLAVLEKVRLDVRLVDSNGGLARLGRESYPVRPADNRSSQGPNGDSWSGDRSFSHFNSESLKDDEEDELPDADEDEDITEETPIDARNAASILGGSTF